MIQNELESGVSGSPVDFKLDCSGEIYYSSSCAIEGKFM